jgi:hypothetical protein
MIVCELCSYYSSGDCKLGLKIPKGMSCRAYGPGIERFCSDPKDFVNSSQVVQMATFFGMKGTELRKVKLMALNEETLRTQMLTPATHLTSSSSRDRYLVD